MLVLQRNVGETVTVTHTDTGDQLTISLVAIPGDSGKRAKIGIEAPEVFNVVRTEIIGRVKHKLRRLPRR